MSPAHASIFRDQFRALKGAPPVDCGDCQRTVPVRFMYRCLDCGVWYCLACIKQHFGRVGRRA